MGYDVNIERLPDVLRTSPQNLSVLEIGILSDFRKLNSIGKEKACDAVRDLTEISRYTEPEEKEKTGT